MGNKASLMLQDEEIRQISEETGFSAQQIEKLYSRFTHLDRANCGSLSKNDLMSIPELAINPLCDRLIEMFFSSKHGGRREDQLEERINFRQFMKVLAAFRTSHLHGQAAAASGGRTSGLNNNNALPPPSPMSKVRPKTGLSPDNNRQVSQRDTIKVATLERDSEQPVRVAASTRAKSSSSHRRGRNGDNNADQNNNHLALVESLSGCLKEKLYFLFKIYDADNDGRISFNDLRSILKMMVGNYIEDVQLDKIATRAFVEVDQDNDGFVEFGEFVRVFAGKDMGDKLRVRFF